MAMHPSQFRKIATFAWDQSDNNVSVYAEVPGVKASGAAVHCSFSRHSFDLRIVGHNGTNLRLFQTPLAKAIEPGKSKWRVKNNRVVVLLRKVKNPESFDLHWMELTSKTGKVPKSKSSDPAASVMTMMQQMYNDGDDNMKRTIAEAWTKSREGKPGAGLDGLGAASMPSAQM